MFDPSPASIAPTVPGGGFRLCTRCAEIKPETRFEKRKQYRSHVCRDCRNARDRELREVRHVPIAEEYRFPTLPPFTEEEAAWKERAACRGMDPTLWFNSPPTTVQGISLTVWANERRRVCATCPVIMECRALADSLDVAGRDLGGFWGGERQAERTRRRAREELKKVA